MGQVVTEGLRSLRGLSKLILRGTGSGLSMEFGRGLVVHSRDVNQYGVMTGTPTPAQEMKEGVCTSAPRAAINLCGPCEKEVNLTADLVMLKCGSFADTAPCVQCSKPMRVC